MHLNTTSAPIIVQTKLLQMIADISAIDPAIIQAEIEQYLEEHGVSSPGYVYDRNYISAASWTIDHNLNKYPQITIIDDEGYQIEADVLYGNLNQVTVMFAEPQSGKAVLI